MYEYDVYADARQTLPRLREPLQAMDGEYYLVKTDILGRTMSFSSSKDSMANLVTIPVSRVREILAINRAGKKVDSIIDKDSVVTVEEPTYRTEEDSITRFDNQSKRRRKNKNRDRSQRNRQEGSSQEAQPAEQSNGGGEQENRDGNRQGRDRHNRRNNRNRRDNRHDNAKPQNQGGSAPANKEE
jgi:hypothetical protein